MMHGSTNIESLTTYVALLWVAFGQPCSNIQSTLR